MRSDGCSLQLLSDVCLRDVIVSAVIDKNWRILTDTLAIAAFPRPRDATCTAQL